MVKNIIVFSMAIGIALVIGLIVAFPTQLLWDWALVPAVNGINPIGFWQAWGLMVLFSILFKNTTTINK
jgi:hypothetical protein